EPFLSRCVVPNGKPFADQNISCRIIHGDAFTTLPLMPHAYADLAIIDPPYNMRKNFHGTVFTEKTAQDYHRYTERWLSLLLPVLKPHASLYICADWKTSIIIADVLGIFAARRQLYIRNRITWEREKGRAAARNWKNAHEDIWFVTVDSSYTFNLEAVKIRKKVVAPYRVNGKPKDWTPDINGNVRITAPSNLWNDISVPYWSMAENTAHPTQKPEKLLAKLILASSHPDDMVFDPFLGSGTTAVTAQKLGRRWCGIELNAQYCAWAAWRLERAERDRTIQGYADGTFWERNSSAAQNTARRLLPRND
ncbi:MAG: site-specific DNA-methyltransferase, partial [Treponema sp.]|nr:site-specific DNA-methyltransferase [Treponema sp.]